MRAIWIMLSNCTDPARDADFNKWYNTMHIPDLTATPGILSGQRYRNLKEKLDKDEPRYMALYTVESENPWALLRRVAQVDDKIRYEKGRMHPCIEAKLLSSWDALIEPRFINGHKGQARLDKYVPKRLAIALGDLAEGDGAREWFSGEYLSSLLRQPGSVWAQSFTTMRPNLRPGDCRNLAILATESADASALSTAIVKDAGVKPSRFKMSYHAVWEHVGP